MGASCGGVERTASAAIRRSCRFPRRRQVSADCPLVKGTGCLWIRAATRKRCQHVLYKSGERAREPHCRAEPFAGGRSGGSSLASTEDRISERPNHRRKCEERFGKKSGNFAVLNPGAGWGAKRWPPERYGQVAKELAAGGVKSLINF